MATSRYDFISIVTNSEGQVRNGYKIVGFILLLYIVLTLIASIPIIEQIVDPIRYGITIAIILSISWFFLKHEGEPLSSIGLHLNVKFLIEFIVGTVISILLILVIAFIIKHLGGFSWIRNHQVGLGQLFYALVPFLGVSIMEELLFRGYVFQRAIRGLGSTYALLLFGLLFSIAHWGNPGMEGIAKITGSLNIGLAAIILGLAYIKTQSLAMPFGIHLGWNWAQGSLLGFGVSGIEFQGFFKPVFNDSPNWVTGGDFGLEAALPATIVCLVACIGFALWGTKTLGNILQKRH